MSEEYICKDSFAIETHGTVHEVSEIHIPTPTGRQQALFARLEGQVNAIFKILEKDAQDLIKGFTPEALEAGVKASSEIQSSKKKDERSIEEQIDEFLSHIKSSGFDCTQCYSILKDLLCARKGGAKCRSENGEFELKDGHWDDIPMNEIKRLLGFYYINFMNTSD